MKLALTLAATLAMGTMGLFGADQTLTGSISDAMCAGHHPAGMAAKACTMGCVKKGSKYVVVVGDKVYNVSNQDLPGLAKYAGDNVKVKGMVDGDTITITKISKAS